MKKTVRRVRTVVFSAMLVALTATLAQAQATRTWVSGLGNDANPCSLTAPCKTFAGAISKTAAGGEIDALDPGGYGAVTITKSITIDGTGTMASILASGTQGIVINNAAAIVHLRNLSIDGAGITLGTNAINVMAASEVHIEKCLIQNFSNDGINYHPASGFLTVSDTTIWNAANIGVAVSTGRATIENLHASANGAAVSVIGSAIATVRNSFADSNGTGFQAIVNAAAVINLENVVITNNTNGVQVGNGATARLSNTTVVSNGSTGMVNDGVSFLVSLSGNIVFGNVTNGTFTSTNLKQ
jgi:hypothetical protein